MKKHEFPGSTNRRTLLLSSGALLLAANAKGQSSVAAEASDGVPTESPGTFQVGPVVATTAGKVRGYLAHGIHTFRGLRYGAPTSPPNRFQPPQPPAPWSGVMSTYVSGGGDRAPQAEQRPASPTAPGVDPPMSEDCLFLNLFTPGLGDGKKRPVMVWLHGGGWSSGSGTEPLFDGTRLATKGDVVIVTVNHRLNIFGYTYLAPLLGAEYADSGNNGVLDIIAALRWVKDNIANFGGDSGNVTLFGWSSGGSEVSQLLAMPLAKGLFHKAIVQSGSQITLRTTEAAARAADQLLSSLKIPRERAREILTLPMATLLTAPSAPGRAAPMVDGGSTPRQPWSPDAPETAAEVSMLVGGTDSELALGARDEVLGMNERTLETKLRSQLGEHTDSLLTAYRKQYPQATPGQLFIFIGTGLWTTKRVLEQVERKAAQGKASVYCYEWIWRSPVEGGKFLSHHGVDVPFVWDNLAQGEDRVGLGAGHQALADRWSARWLAFAHTGSPNARGLVEWKPYTLARRETLVVNNADQLVSDPFHEVRIALDNLPQSFGEKMLR
ncbi:MAG: carboxylesterase family protein [Pseudomonadota bacterium]